MAVEQSRTMSGVLAAVNTLLLGLAVFAFLAVGVLGVLVMLLAIAFLTFFPIAARLVVASNAAAYRSRRFFAVGILALIAAVVIVEVISLTGT